MLFGIIPMGIVMHELNIPPPPVGTPSPFALADISILQIYRFHSERINVTFEFAIVEGYVSYTKAVSAPIVGILSKESVKRQEEILNMVRERVRNNNVITNDNSANQQSVRMDNECI
jgi:hypothetical protein